MIIDQTERAALRRRARARIGAASVDGRERPDANAIKLGLAEESPRVPEDAEAVVGRSRLWYFALKPLNAYHAWLVDQVSITTLRIRAGRPDGAAAPRPGGDRGRDVVGRVAAGRGRGNRRWLGQAAGFGREPAPKDVAGDRVAHRPLGDPRQDRGPGRRLGRGPALARVRPPGDPDRGPRVRGPRPGDRRPGAARRLGAGPGGTRPRAGRRTERRPRTARRIRRPRPVARRGRPRRPHDPRISPGASLRGDPPRPAPLADPPDPVQLPPEGAGRPPPRILQPHHAAGTDARVPARGNRSRRGGGPGPGRRGRCRGPSGSRSDPAGRAKGRGEVTEGRGPEEGAGAEARAAGGPEQGDGRAIGPGAELRW